MIGLLRHCARVSLRLLFMQTFLFDEKFDKCNMLGLDVCVFLGKALYHLHNMHTHNVTQSMAVLDLDMLMLYPLRSSD